MKKLNILILFLTILFCCSCDDFLSQESEDLIIPKTVADYQELLQGEAYPLLENEMLFTDLLSDDVDETPIGGFGFGDSRMSYKNYYTWQREMELQDDGSYRDDQAWDILYKIIMLSNISLDDADGLNSKQEEIDFLKGEAYFLRAYSYFLLVNLYGKPYNESSSDSDLGVPINLTPYVQDKLFKRETVAKVYQQIEEDLNNGVKAFTESGIQNSIYHASLDVCNFLFSRVYLYQKNWDKAIEYANKVLENHSVLNDISADGINIKTPFYVKSNPEIIFSYGGFEESSVYNGYSFYGASDALVNLYADEDNRKLNYLSYGYDIPFPGPRLVPNKYKLAKHDIFYKAFRLSEMYLNRAEAYAEKGEFNNAISDIKFLRQHRLTDDAIDFPSDETLIQAVHDERRRELCFEGHRWFDLRRWNQPKIVHKYSITKTEGSGPWAETVVASTASYTLEEKDAAYTLQIPFKVREFNPSMTLNERPERNPSGN